MGWGVPASGVYFLSPRTALQPTSALRSSTKLFTVSAAPPAPQIPGQALTTRTEIEEGGAAVVGELGSRTSKFIEEAVRVRLPAASLEEGYSSRWLEQSAMASGGVRDLNTWGCRGDG